MAGAAAKVGTNLGFSRIYQELGQGYEGLRFGHFSLVCLVHESSDKDEQTNGVDSIEHVFFHLEIEVLDVDSHLSGVGQ